MKGRPKLHLSLSPEDRAALNDFAQRGGNSPALAFRARIVLACAEGLDNADVAARVQSTAHTVSKWRRRFIMDGLQGLTDLPRSGAPQRIGEATVAAIASRKPDGVTAVSSARHVARESNVSASTVGRIWQNMDRPVKRSGSHGQSRTAHPSAGSEVASIKAAPPTVNQEGEGSSDDRLATDVGSGESPYLPDDLAQAFRMAPVGLLLSRQRVIVSCNYTFGEIFGCAPNELAGRSLEYLYPSQDEFRHIGERAWLVMKETGFYSDERIMQRLDGSPFWCHVSGRSMNRDDPFATAIWAFEDISSVRRVTRDLTRREREVAQLLVTGKSSKQIARELQISHRTVEAHRARLMRKYAAMTTGELIGKLLGRDR
ncbi:PAS domain S-box-containing protein [Paraburkholderia sp. HC6.4b]|uniref:LuxR C-terminal-related transcriptional regulator n=1 Tax=unclassified Paraburkholderia TaxID=2615204 RepID=UPI0016088E80|nr:MULTISPECIES: LuxR C-terminal-related transcriptional regulator [unclassified Paraburkholderia]MBB5409989.1 PAS domain S-box-containing protein [Paraburkholderia sp. HC6.4b]MBB5452096.1 PAS domain S-box-containing protein [Paraburkholderia sp. Kb1A]